eukprot:8152876-Lingulodinium_polyedra.AAC.1
MVDKHGSTGPGWGQVIGPTGAVLATCSRLGWKMADWNIFIDDKGMEHNCSRVPPGYIKRLVDSATVRWVWKKVAEAPSMAGLAQGALFQP